MTEQTEAQDLFSSLDAAEGETPTPPEPAAAPDPASEIEAQSEPAPAPAAAAAATPTPAAEGTPAPVAEQPPAESKHGDRTVPLAVHLEERKQYREELASLRAELEKIRNPAPAAATPEAEKDYFDDPKGYTDSRTKALLDRLEALEKSGTERLNAVEQQAQAQNLDRQLSAAQEQFAASTPDYVDALQHLREVRIRQAKLSNPEATDQQIIAHLAAEERDIAARVLAQKRNPAEYVYQLAKTFGYTPRAQAPAAAPTPAPVNGASAGTVPADVTLNRTPGQSPPGPDEGDDGDEDGILDQAKQERFRKRA